MYVACELSPGSYNHVFECSGQLDERRNQLMGINVKLSVLAIGIAASTAVAGVFGMNLTHGLESAPGAFFAVTVLCGAVFGATNAHFQQALQQQSRTISTRVSKLLEGHAGSPSTSPAASSTNELPTSFGMSEAQFSLLCSTVQVPGVNVRLPTHAP